MFRCFVTSILFVLSANVSSADIATHSGKITQIGAFPHNYGTYNENEKGRLTIYIDGIPPGCESGLPRVVIGVDHPIYDSVLSIALMAKASQTEVTVTYFKECTIRGNSWDLANLVIE